MIYWIIFLFGCAHLVTMAMVFVLLYRASEHWDTLHILRGRFDLLRAKIDTWLHSNHLN
jgi:hypothetical protein